MADKPQIKCPNCKTQMPYTAAECPNCKRRMVGTISKSKSNNNAQTFNKSPMIGGFIAGGILLVLILFCCSSGKQSPEQQQMIQRQEEMRPVMNEMNRKMAEGKTKEDAAREIIDDEIRRQQIKELDELIEQEEKKNSQK